MKQALRISWLRTADRPGPPDDTQANHESRLENPADVVYRLMARKTFRGGFKHQKTTESPALIQYDRALGSMSAGNRIRWRWARRSSLQKAEPSTPDPECPGQPWPRVDSIDVGSTEKFIATFGHIVSATDPATNKSAAHCALLPTVPHPAALTSLINTWQEDWSPVAKETAIVLHFQPHPGRGANDQAFDVRLHIPVDAGADLSSFQIPSTASLSLVAEERADIYFPSAAVDAMLHSQHLIPLNINAEPIQTFLAASEFNLAEGRLRTPRETTFEVPFSNGLRTPVEGLKNPKPKVEEMPYLFIGLEVHQSVEMPWKGLTLRYNSIEAGLHGGQRQELSIIADVPRGTKRQDRQAAYESVKKLTKEIANGEHFSWSRGAANVEPA